MGFRNELGERSLKINQNGILQFDAVDESNPGIITAAGTIIAIIEDPLLSILKEDLRKTHPARQIGSPCLDHDSAPPRSTLLMKHFIPDSKKRVLLAPRLSDGGIFGSSLGKVSHRR